MSRPHVATIDFKEFYRPVFADADAASAFVTCVEGLAPEQGTASVVLHQAARMLWLADRVDEVASGRPALCILFYLIAAELVAKIVRDYKGEGRSREHVRLFFEDICSQNHRGTLETAFTEGPFGRALPLREVIDSLYDVRSDVVHEGGYYDFQLPQEDDQFLSLTELKGRVLTPRITVRALRRIVLEGAVLGAARLLPLDCPCRDFLPPR